MFCKYCGNRMKDTDLVCPHCKKEREPMQSALELKQLLGEKWETERKSPVSGSGEGNTDSGMMQKRWMLLENRQKHLEKNSKCQNLLMKSIAASLVLFLVITMAVSCSLSRKIERLNVSGLEEKMKVQETKLEELKNRIENPKAMMEIETETEAETETETKTEEQTETKTTLAIKEN